MMEDFGMPIDSTDRSSNGISFCSRIFCPDQVEFICDSLYRWRDGARLVRLFQLVDPGRLATECVQHGSNKPSPSVLRAYLYALFHSGDYDTLFRVMAENSFPAYYQLELTDLWYEARYAEDQMRKHKKLGPVDKYRIRKKFPPPRSVWDGDEVIYSFKECARRVLKRFYEENKYPTSEEKREIARQTQLRIVQIANWFKNRRQRDKTGGK
ncbi:homeobox domain-containing protein [Ditylenchus destructor]|nr:homeobox domain-containing protein [Ditylenchus destructor]